MARVRAIRGVCIGVDRHLNVGDIEELDAATVQFLTSIQAVELAPIEAPAAVEPAKREDSDKDKKTRGGIKP